MKQPGEFDAGNVPVVYGDVVQLADEVDPSHGLPADAAHEVSQQLLRALAEADVDPTTVLFSGYDPSNAEIADYKASGGFGHVRPEDETKPAAHEYFFGEALHLADGEEGPFAHAGSSDDPVVGVHDRAKLEAIGINEDRLSVVATPGQIKETLVMEFRPQYERPDEF